MTVSLDLWYPEVNPDIPEVPLVALQLAARSAAIKFCEKTHLWKFDLDDIDVVEDQNEYTLTVPAEYYGEIVAVDSVKYRADGEDEDAFQTVWPVGVSQEDKNRTAGWKSVTMEAPFEFYVDPVDVNTLHLVGDVFEDSTDGLRVSVIGKPSLTASVVADFLYNDHRETIGWGTLENLYRRKGQPWYDIQLSGYFGKMFDSKCGDGKMRKARGATTMDMSVKMRPMA